MPFLQASQVLAYLREINFNVHIKIEHCQNTVYVSIFEGLKFRVFNKMCSKVNIHTR